MAKSAVIRKAAPLLLVGGGKMGSILLRGWVGRGINAANIVIVEPSRQNRSVVHDTAPDAAVIENVSKLDNTRAPSVVVFAVKPQIIKDVAAQYRHFVRPSCLFLSIAAGTPINLFESILGRKAAIVRAMPNTPAAVGRGITAVIANAEVSVDQHELCTSLLEAVGEVIWIDNESLMDPITAVSGSGPAYVFLLIECLAAAGVKAGLDSDLATKLARATVSGAGELVYQSTDTATELRKNVTSPGGTTEAALDILMADKGMHKLVNQAVSAATKRSKELAGKS